jgi:hypothetical protein
MEWSKHISTDARRIAQKDMVLPQPIALSFFYPANAEDRSTHAFPTPLHEGESYKIDTRQLAAGRRPVVGSRTPPRNTQLIGLDSH